MHDSREFTTIRDVYKETKKGLKLVKKNVTAKMRIYLDEIYMVEELTDGKGKLMKDRCVIGTRDKGFVIIKDNYSRVSSEIFSGSTKQGKIGFDV